MSPSLDHFLDRVYHVDNYHCAHFARDVWLFLTGEDIIHRLGAFLPNYESDQKNLLAEQLRGRRLFTKLTEPVSPCIAMMERTRRRTTPHFGVYVDGGIIHLHPTGVEYHEPAVAARAFDHVRYYV